MHKCPNCSAHLKFHIQTQRLHCEYCDTTVGPYYFYQEQNTLENTYETTVFTCPDCGGEIISEDTTVATFCSFCGSPNILQSHISNERRPKYIIPFSKTKEDCKTAYEKLVKHAFFAPDDLKDINNIEKFRGIYMPYWIYSVYHKEPITMYGNKDKREEDYIITSHYELQTEIDAEYRGLTYDASSSFSDNLSNAIAPFELKDKKPFTPAFLSGFYADTSDVDSRIYQHPIINMAEEHSCNEILKDKILSEYHVNSTMNLYNLKNALRPVNATADLALFPVWFLTYRKGDRVAYAVVNGQTGKATADFPVDIKKYLIGSLILSVPIFIYLNMEFTLIPSLLLFGAMMLALACMMISMSQLSKISLQESGEDDKGLKASNHKPTSGNNKLRQGPILIKPILAIIFSIFVLAWNPIFDHIYYGCGIICLCMICWCLTDIIKCHNILTTRKLPQFNKRGGDELA